MRSLSGGLVGAVVLTAITALNLVGSAAHALPAFASREGKPCGYCHNNPRGGGPRNYRGLYYKAHNLTFAQFDDAAEAKQAGVGIAPDPNPSVKPRSWTPPPAPEPPAPPPTKVETPPSDPAELGDKTAPASPIARAAEKVNAARGAYTKKPTPTAKRAYAQALAELGQAIWIHGNTEEAARRKEALALYKRALALDPKNALATAERRKLLANSKAGK